MSEEKLEIEWNSYMRCNGLPSPNDPSDLRKYIHMWTDDVKKLNKKEINWLLKTNEQSILTQDQTVIDLSRANLKKIQPEVGEMYAKRATEVLGILHEMDSVIRDRYSMSPNKMDDLLDVSGFHSKTFFSLFNPNRFISHSFLPQYNAAEAGNPCRFVIVCRWLNVQNIEQYWAQHDVEWINSSNIQVRVDGVQNRTICVEGCSVATAIVRSCSYIVPSVHIAIANIWFYFQLFSTNISLPCWTLNNPM